MSNKLSYRVDPETNAMIYPKSEDEVQNEKLDKIFNLMLSMNTEINNIKEEVTEIKQMISSNIGSR
jgi:hypothetical protein